MFPRELKLKQIVNQNIEFYVIGPGKIMNEQAEAAARADNKTTILFSVAVALLFFIGSGGVAYLNVQLLSTNTQKVAHTHEVILAIEETLSYIKDAETGQRGFILTGDHKYLAPYDEAKENIDRRAADLQKLAADNPAF